MSDWFWSSHTNILEMRLSCSLKRWGEGLLRALVSSIHTFLGYLGLTKDLIRDSSMISLNIIKSHQC